MSRLTIWDYAIAALALCFVIGTVLAMCTREERCFDGHREFSGEACK